MSEHAQPDEPAHLPTEVPEQEQRRSFHCVTKGCEVAYAPFWDIAGESVNLCHEHYAQWKNGKAQP